MNRKVAFGCAVFAIAVAGVAALAQPAAESDSAREVARLRRAIKSANQGADAVGARIGPLQQDVLKLEEKLKAIDPPKLKAEAEEPIDPKSIETPKQAGGPTPSNPKMDEAKDKETWRLPLVRESDKKTNLLVVCQNNKVYIADLQALTAAVDKDMGRTLQTNGTYFLATGDYNVAVTPTIIKCVLKQDRKGQSVEQALQPGSDLQKQFAKLPPSDNIIQFCVYPDSYDAFKTVRRMTYEKKYDVGWSPMAVGGEISLGGGKASGQ